MGYQVASMANSIVESKELQLSPQPLVPGGLADHTSCLALKVGQVVFRLMENRLSALGLRVRHYSVLQTLFERGSMPQQDLGTCLRIDSATMVATIDDLEGSGYVTRVRSLADRRSYEISILPQGRSVLKRLNAMISDLDGAIFADLTAKQLDDLHRMLGKLSSGTHLASAFDDLRGR